jgi:hypothetical protein
MWILLLLPGGAATWAVLTYFFYPPAGPSAPVPLANVARSAGTAGYESDIAPLIDQYCISCHSGDKPKGKLALDKFKDDASVVKSLGTWEKIATRVGSHEMPPPEKLQPSASETQFLLSWIDVMTKRFRCTGAVNPGSVTLRRLNRAEYNNTIRDLVGIDFRPGDDFPADDTGYGFDNIGDVLSVPPLLLEKYLAAAEEIVERAWAAPSARRRILICQPVGNNARDCAARNLDNFARRAFRRPLIDDELKRLVDFAMAAQAQGDSFEKGIQIALQAILTSPHFVFKVERTDTSDEDGIYRLSEYELATRLSYFLWSSMPDDQLLALADAKRLRSQLDAQVRRMLKDAKAKALFDNFAAQWLQLRPLREATPDPAQFTNFTDALRDAMRGETERFFMTILNEDRSILDFLDSDFTFVNGRLAKHYGIAGGDGDEFHRVQLTDKRRGGLLTQASILTVTSLATRTAPVKRGKWILETILGAPPPPPLPDAGQLDESKAAVLASTVRQRMEQHRANPKCAACHARLDPLGFALENYDAIGSWRDKDGTFPIDASASLPHGPTFTGPIELKKVLLASKDDFCKCLTERLLTFAVGRGMEYEDKCVIERIARTVAQDNYKLSRIIMEVIRCELFQSRLPTGNEDGF